MNYVKGNVKLWKESVEHWRQNLDMLILNYLSGIHVKKKKDQYLLYTDIGLNAKDCPFCTGLFKWAESRGCGACPIYKKTKKGGCEKTPFNDVFLWTKRVKTGRMSRRDLYKLGFKVISAELNFLLSLKD